MIYTEDGILAELETQLSSKSQWRKTLFYGVYRRLNAVVAYVVNKFVYLAEFLYKESSWNSATQLESLVARCEYYWYNPHRKVGASGNVQLIGDPTWEIDLTSGESYQWTGASVIIPQWTQFTDDDNEVFVYSTEQKIYYNGTESYIDIPVKEGVPKEFIYIAKGEASEQIELLFDDIDDEEIYVYIVDDNNTVLHNVTRCEVDVDDKLFFIQDLVNYYCSIKNSFTLDSVIITFGDGIKSRALALNQRVLVKYAQTKGLSGNITNADTITTIKSTLTDANEVKVDLYVRNLEVISGGDDVEDIEDIRFNAPNIFNAGFRLGGYDDWQTILEADTRVYKAKIWSTDDEEDDTLTEKQNKIYIVAISSTGEALTATQQDSIAINVLKPIKSPTEVVSWETLKKIYAIFDIEAVIVDEPFTVAESLINTGLNAEYDIFNADFKKSIYESNFYANINNNDFVVRHTSQIKHGEKEEYSILNHIILPSVLASEDSNTKNQIYVKPLSVEVWVREKDETGVFGDAVRAGYEVYDTPSQGTIIGDNGYTISSSAVVYNLNSISFTVDDFSALSASDYEVMLVYITQDGTGIQDNDIRLPYFDLITDFDEAYNQFDLSYE